MVGMTPSRSEPDSGPVPRRAQPVSASASDRIRPARATISAPAAVMMTRRRSRSTRRRPSAASSSLIAPLSVDWVTQQARAARLNERYRASATRYCSCRSVGSAGSWRSAGCGGASQPGRALAGAGRARVPERRISGPFAGIAMSIIASADIC